MTARSFRFVRFALVCFLLGDSLRQSVFQVFHFCEEPYASLCDSALAQEKDRAVCSVFHMVAELLTKVQGA